MNTILAVMAGVTTWGAFTMLFPQPQIWLTKRAKVVLQQMGGVK